MGPNRINQSLPSAHRPRIAKLSLECVPLPQVSSSLRRSRSEEPEALARAPRNPIKSRHPKSPIPKSPALTRTKTQLFPAFPDPPPAPAILSPIHNSDVPKLNRPSRQQNPGNSSLKRTTQTTVSELSPPTPMSSLDRIVPKIPEFDPPQKPSETHNWRPAPNKI
jgi:hypothetical protein